MHISTHNKSYKDIYQISFKYDYVNSIIYQFYNCSFCHSGIYFKISLFIIKGKCFQDFVILVSLKCSMDVQSSGGRGMLLQYVTGYVTKMKDHNIFQGLILILYIKILQTHAFSKP